MIKIFATDLDGTLLFPKKRIRLISTKNQRFLRGLAQKGIKVVFVTGRNKRFCEKIAKRLRINCDFISDSGGRITINGENKKLAIIPNSIALDISDSLHREDIKAVFAIGTEDSRIYCNAWAQGKLWEMFLKTYSLKDLFLSEHIHVTKRQYNRQMVQAKILKMNLIFLTKYEKMVKQFMTKFESKYQNELEFNYGGNYLEITHFGCNKAHAVEELMGYYGFQKEEVIVVGDEGNDFEMIKRFPNSFAMKRGSELIKSVAKYVINQISDIDKFIKL